MAGYQASGGIRGAVAQSAEALYGELGEAERTQLRDLVLRLVVPGPEGEPVRGRCRATRWSRTRHTRTGSSSLWSRPGWSPATTA